MQLDRNLLISMFIVGVMSHYTKEEISKYKDINNILMKLQKRNFAIKNGTTDDRLWCDAAYVRGKIMKQPKKAEQFQQRGIRAAERAVARYNSWTTHSKIADRSYRRASDYFSETNEITVNQLVMALLRKEESVAKAYKFTKKDLAKFANNGVKGHIFSSSRVATKLIEFLDEEIAHHNYNLEVA